MWMILMLAAALSQAVKDLLLKRCVEGLEPLAVVWAYCLSTTVFLILAALPGGVPEIRPGFWIALGVTGPFAALSLYCYVKSLELTDLSLAAPMLAMTPLFMLVTSPAMVGHAPDAAGAAGIVLIVAGAYVLKMNGAARGIFEPFKALARDKGARLMLLVAFMWSVSANIDVIGLSNSSPLFWIACAFGATTLCLTPLVALKTRRGFAQVLSRPWELCASGILETVTCACQMYALTVAMAPYVIAVKRVSAVFAVLLGWLALGEGNAGRRLAGAALMVLGVFLIALLG
jgi:drug/metabolite transporter (DMT)-like permease